MRFPSPETLSLKGLGTVIDTFDLMQGWNLIGSVSRAVKKDSVITDPPGMFISSFWTYGGRYWTEGAVRPGRGYWIKVAGAGRLILKAQ